LPADPSIWPPLLRTSLAVIDSKLVPRARAIPRAMRGEIGLCFTIASHVLLREQPARLASSPAGSSKARHLAATSSPSRTTLIRAIARQASTSSLDSQANLRQFFDHLSALR